MKKLLSVAVLVASIGALNAGNDGAKIPDAQHIKETLHKAKKRLEDVQYQTAKTIADANRQAAKTSQELVRLQAIEAQAAAINKASMQSNDQLRELSRKKAAVVRDELRVRDEQNRLDSDYSKLQRQLQSMRLAV